MKTAQRITAAFTALAFYLSLAAPYVAHAQVPDDDAPSEDSEQAEGTGAGRTASRANGDDESDDAEAEDSTEDDSEEGRGRRASRSRDEEAEEGKPSTDGNETEALPSGPGKSAVTPQAISLPKGEGSIEGMGESFTPNLSAGTGTFSVPIALPAGRAGVQPSLALSYSTAGGNGPVGIGWSIAAPFISRQTDRGLPKYLEVSGGRWHEEEDRFMYNGGQELVPVDNDDASDIDGAAVPSHLASWQQYRARVEGAFMRFFRSPQHDRWIVQDKGGTLFEFGVVGDGPSGMAAASRNALLSEEPNGQGRIFQWLLTRMSDAHGSTVYYTYGADQGQRYLEHIYYVSPAVCAVLNDPNAQRTCAQDLSTYARRVKLVYEPRSDVFDSYITTWKVSTARRLKRVEVTAAMSEGAGRTLVRRYHLRYDASSFLSLLSEVQVEGRAHGTGGAYGAAPPAGEDQLGDGIVGALLPAMTFAYSRPVATTGGIPGFGGVDGTVLSAPSSPPHSLDEARTDLFDVNSDGLPDVIVTDPARYRTNGDQAAVGVFFNGFRGNDAVPGEAGGFSSAVPVPMPDGDSGVMHLGNLNIVPMDIDGDGRSDLLHMPRVASYGYYTPARALAPGATPAWGEDVDSTDEVSPKRQAWQFAKVAVDSATGFNDPRIDFGRDGEFIQVVDVNNDHLIDVVRTTGTAMQTWLNLGWIPGGDGRFGQAHHNGSRWVLNPEPLESCVLQGALPVDFGDPELRLADMNGDGLQDIVQIRRGRVQYWAGRGPGLWGEGSADCTQGFGANRYVDMATPPQELSPEVDNVFVSDINGDGAADVVQVRTQEIDVYFNRAGRSFTARTIIDDTPFAPSFAPRVRFADVDGSGTTDILFGTANNYRWIDPMGGQRPRLLIGVENGLGGLTTLEYDSSVNDYLADLDDALSCQDSSCERFTWSASRGDCDAKVEAAGGGCVMRSGGSPVVSTVVRAVSTSDQMASVTGQSFVKRTEYAYHDAYYEGIEQEFRGFGAADAIEIGDAAHPTAITRTHFYQGRRPNHVSSDRTEDNPLEALKGRTYRTEVMNEQGEYLSSEHASFALRHLLAGENGVAVSYAFVNRTDTVLYDTAPFVPTPGATLVTSNGAGAWTSQVPTLRFEHADGSGVAWDGTEERMLPLRGLGHAVMMSTVDSVDNAGNMLAQTAWGRVRGEAGESHPDERITQHSAPTRLGSNESWLWRTASTHVTGSQTTGSLAATANEYNANGDLVVATQTVSYAGIPTLTFRDDDRRAWGFSQSTAPVVASTSYDTWGNAIASCGGGDLSDTGTADCLRYGSVDYDSAYAMFPREESIATTRNGSGFATLDTAADWDMGLGVLVRATDPNGLETSVTYDGLGRLTSMTPPSVAGCSMTGALTQISYTLGSPVSTITTTTQQGCTSSELFATTTYVDGLGRARASVIPAEGTTSTWQLSGKGTFSARGAAVEAYLPTLVSAFPSPGAAIAIDPSVLHTTTRYDAFSRPVVQLAQDMTPVMTSRYHALGTEAWDANDNDTSSAHRETPTIERKDGHGRVIDQVLQNRKPGLVDEEYYRLFTTYRADGQVIGLTRAQTYSEAVASPVVEGRTSSRVFYYDSVGRRVGGSDPDTDHPTNSAHHKGWRYLYNRVGDLIAVRDPRGCGQNFYYDHAGRLIAEVYATCDEAQPAPEVPTETLPDYAISETEAHPHTVLLVDARYYFDAYPDWFTEEQGNPALASFPAGGASIVNGRATAVGDRGQRSVMAYDPRGNVIWAARQMAVIPSARPIDLTPNGDVPALDAADTITSTYVDVLYDGRWYTREATFDYASRPRQMWLPFEPQDTATRIGGRISYNARNLPSRVEMLFESAGVVSAQDVVASLAYTADGLVERTVYGDEVAETEVIFDQRRRPVSTITTRPGVIGTDPNLLSDVSVVDAQALGWDAVSNLVSVMDQRSASEWPDGFEPRDYLISHDALYRVADVLYSYDNNGEDPVDPEPNVCVAPDPVWPPPAVSYPAPTQPTPIADIFESPLPQYQASASPGPILLDFTKGQFSRESVATRMDVDEDGEMYLEMVPAGIIRAERRQSDPEDAPPLYLFEGARENLQRRTTDINLWTAHQGASVLPNTQAGPMVGSAAPMADTVSFSTSSTWAAKAYLTANGQSLAAATVFTSSVFHYSGIGRIFIARPAPHYWSPDLSSASTWVRSDATTEPLGYFGLARPALNSDLPQDWVVWGAQLEAASFPSSYIERPTAEDTWRHADSLTFAQAPSTMTQSVWGIDVYPEYGSGDGLSEKAYGLANATFALMSFANAGNAIALHFDTDGVGRVRVLRDGVATDSDAFTWSRQQRLHFTVDPVAETVTVQGGTSVSVPSAPRVPAGLVRVGALHDSATGGWVVGTEAFARISEPRRLLNTDPMTSCPSGFTRGTDNGDHYGLAATDDVCVPNVCTGSAFWQNCGTVASTCGLCCTQDSDCGSGRECGVNGGPRKGLPVGTNVCWDDECDTTRSPAMCGATSRQCGLCPVLPGGGVLLSFSDGTFSRGSAATRLDFDDEGDLIVESVGFDALRTERHKSDPAAAPPLYLFEGQRMNFVRRSTDFDGSTWTRAGLRTVPEPDGVGGDVIAAPDATRSRTADTVYYGTSSGTALQSYIYINQYPPHLTVTADASLTTSAFMRGSRMRIRVTAGAVTQWTDNLPAVAPPSGSGWTRESGTREYVLGPNINTYLRLEPPHAHPWPETDVTAWGAQAELGPFPSSFIYTSGNAATRLADKLEFAAELVPTALRSGQFRFDVYPEHGSSDAYVETLKATGLRNQTFGLLSFDSATTSTPADGIALYYDNNGKSHVRVVQHGEVTDIRHDWVRDERIAIRVDLSATAPRIAIGGAWHVLPSTSFVATGSLLIGGAYNDGHQLDANMSAFARISEPLPFAIDCMSNADCPGGHVCGADNGALFGSAHSDVCWPVYCESEQNLHCGTETDACGACCVDDSDCAPGEWCAVDDGSRKGLGAGSNVCLPSECEAQVLTAQQCGSPTAACGLCPASTISTVLHFDEGSFVRSSVGTALDFDATTRGLIVRSYGTNTLRPERRPTDITSAPLYLFEGERTNWVQRSGMALVGNVWGMGNTVTQWNSAIGPDGRPNAATVNTTPVAPYNLSQDSKINMAGVPVSGSGETVLFSHSIFYQGPDAWLWATSNGGYQGYVTAPATTAWSQLDGRATSIANGQNMSTHFGRKGGEPVSTLLAWGGQRERAPFPSSFIYTEATGAAVNTRAADQLSFTSTPTEIQVEAWEVDIYPIHGSLQDGYNATTLPLGLRDKDFGLFAWSGDTGARDGNYISLRYDNAGGTSLHIQQSAGEDVDISFAWQRHQPIRLLVDPVAGKVSVNGIERDITWEIPSGPMMVGSLYDSSGNQLADSSAFARISEPRAVPTPVTCEDNDECSQGTICGNSIPDPWPTNTTDTSIDWRTEMATVQSDDPMAMEPAPNVMADADNAAETRVMNLVYDYDWLANMTSWDDDAQQFYERSIGLIHNGFEVSETGTPRRPSALYLASDLPSDAPIWLDGAERGGYLELDYGLGGNVERMTVRAQCRDASTSNTCYDDHNPSLSARRDHLHAACVCAAEQHYQYRWDELNRIAEARRYERSATTSTPHPDWNLVARQRYRYDSANQRTIKQTYDVEHTDGDAEWGLDTNFPTDPPVEAIALYVYPGDFERRGLMRVEGANGLEYESPIDGGNSFTAESQYLVGGARIVMKDPGAGEGELHPDDRVTVGITDLIGTTSAVIDLVSGALVETSTYYPNGARETYRAPDTENVAAEPYGFTGKEADEEVGVTYFGERYLISRIGRWASPDPLSVHAAGGGEALNAYHYVSGNLLQARDPLGLDPAQGAGGMSASRENGVGGGEGARAPSPQQPKIPARDLDMQKLSFAPYGNHRVAGWSSVTGEALRKLGINEADLEDASSGFSANLYVNDRTGDYVLSFEGTGETDVGDYRADASQAFGFETEQYDRAVALARALNDRVGSERLSFAGHSLGGGLASVAALTTGSRAVTFNAAGVADSTLERYNLTDSRANELIRNYRNACDPLTFVQEATFFPDALGEQITLHPDFDNKAVTQAYEWENSCHASPSLPRILMSQSLESAPADDQD